jgi:hypothetical protein
MFPVSIFYIAFTLTAVNGFDSWNLSRPTHLRPLGSDIKYCSTFAGTFITTTTTTCFNRNVSNTGGRTISSSTGSRTSSSILFSVPPKRVVRRDLKKVRDVMTDGPSFFNNNQNKTITLFRVL